MRITNGEARLELAFNTQSGGRHTARACYLLLTALLLAGCSKGPTTKMIYGSVTCGGEKVAIGRVSFVPIDGAEGAHLRRADRRRPVSDRVPGRRAARQVSRRDRRPAEDGSQDPGKATASSKR